MPLRRSLRARALGPGLGVLLLLGGCAAEEASEPDAAVSPSDSPSVSPGSDSDGITTESEELPEWQPIAGLETPRDDFGTAVIGREIWALGGMTGERGNRLLSIEILDTRTGEWRTSDIEMPRGLASFEVVADGPLVYAFGGLDATSTATAFSSVLDTRTGTWRRLDALPHARYAHTVTAYDGLYYVIGGRDGDGPVAEVDVFDPRTEEWTTLDQPMPNARDSHKTAATPAGLVVAGGFRDFEDSDLVDRFDPATGEWSTLPTLPEPMSRSGVVFTEGMVWIALHESAYVLDPSDPEAGWEEANPLTLSRHGMGFVVVDGVIYSIGGCALNPLRDVRTVDRLELA
ncbi:Kelch repeat-containing protein [Nocardioides coralli]|uniref:Kelch repeat-containing protein n=1 Tax=Nocardioides coralli TaxID=2872154 RepID=UPI001CA466DC|nr:kelch repeat-containing protein [Nocardioides coralli]QZY28128.1 hypothetical protein K6T13_11595 [Nocardioides coralli]